MTNKKQRSDGWTQEMDETLAETVLSTLREGKTMKDAFSIIGDKFNKTEAAVQFRWNSEVKKSYEDAVKLAKKYRESIKKSAKKEKKATEQATKKEKRTGVGKVDRKVEKPIQVTQQETTPPVAIEEKSITPTLSETTSIAAPVDKDILDLYDTDFLKMVTNHIGKFNSLTEKVQYLQQQLSVKEVELSEATSQIELLTQKEANSEELQQLRKENEKLKQINGRLNNDLQEFTMLATAIRRLENPKDSEETDAS
ncbi:hypothetical protein [Bacillus cereus group sp. TH152-1LC]|uniref:hypothetical protein n=1 Tax=Bacillus cereus group sp. TH152-1LC TaxID=3018060 RepID=UPI0022E02DA3|nr:hypothetical protein [Bacillus cereus group sp. TH152-1LC]MDA1675036.1 hypothetical protein [Bacillus cereus group sp. TH152-1LC]